MRIHRKRQESRLLHGVFLLGWLLVGMENAFGVPQLPAGLFNKPLPPGLEQIVADTLPERRNVDGAFLNPSYEPWLRLSEDSRVYVSFISEGAGYRNTLGYFSFDPELLDTMNRDQVNQDGGIVSLDELSRIADMTGILFPNVSAVGSKGKLKAGDTLALADGYLFSAGSAIGFFLIQNAWNGSGIRGWNSTGGNPLVFYSWDHINPEAPAGATYSSPGPNTRHVAMQFANPNASEVIMSFEDLHRNRNSDEDFNDAVFMVWSDSDSALSQSRLAGTVPEPGTLMLMLLGISVFAFTTRGSSPG